MWDIKEISKFLLEGSDPDQNQWYRSEQYQTRSDPLGALVRITMLEKILAGDDAESHDEPAEDHDGDEVHFSLNKNDGNLGVK